MKDATELPHSETRGLVPYSPVSMRLVMSPREERLFRNRLVRCA